MAQRTHEQQTSERLAAEQRTFNSYEEFWPCYVAMHSKAAGRDRELAEIAAK